MYDRLAPSWIRKKALEKAYKLVVMEDENTSYQTIGPVSKAMNMLYVSSSERSAALLEDDPG